MHFGDSTTGSFCGNRAASGVIALVVALAMSAPAVGQDSENCLLCHRFRGLSRLERQTGELRLFFCSAEYYAYFQGPHTRLGCTDCHEREEVRKIPHEVKTRVDCTKMCHLDTATGAPIRFTHAPTADTLAGSVHAPAALEKLRFDPPVLHPGQSTCLYCHDEPMFREQVAGGWSSARSGEATERCSSCHRVQIPIPVAYFANHVSSRFEQARPIEQLAQICAVCHSDPAILAQIGGTDAVASYLHSFHGKAKLLGSEETATCINCHASWAGDIHAMLARDEPDSTINAVNVADTCRSRECHPGAAPGMTQAAVHLELDPGRITPEYVVAVLFVTLTAVVMVVFFILILLEFLNVALRRRDPNYEHHKRLAKLVQHTPEGRALLQRMSVHERIQHWLLAISFILLVATGMPVKFANTQWASDLVSLFGGLTVARFLHRVFGVILMGVFFYHVGYLLVGLARAVRAERRRGGTRGVIRLMLESPMVPTLDDVREFGHQFAFLLGLSRTRPSMGRMSFTQKFEYWAVFWGAPIMGASGFVLWKAPWVTEHISGRVLNFAFIIHSDEAYLAFIYIAVVHLFTVVFSPIVFPISLGTLTGQAPAAEIAEQHSAQLEAAARRLGIEVQTPPAPHGPAVLTWIALKRVYSLGMCFVCAWLAFISMRFLIHIVTAHESAPVHITDIPKRLELETLARADVFGSQHRPRSPLAHFHQIPFWFRPDPKNSCTTSGCHAPLPHGERIEVRAFLNMHATFVDCTVCHAGKPGLEPHWFELEQRGRADVPAVLQISALLEALPHDWKDDPGALSARLQELLASALAQAGEHEQLRGWLIELQTTHPTGKLFRSIVEDMRYGIGLHVHGEYAAKIGLYSAQGEPAYQPTAAQIDAARRYVRKSAKLGEPERDALLKVVHEGIEPIGAMCTPCHNAQPTLVDASRLGYPPSRVEALRSSSIVRQVLSIESGQPFFLPLAPETQAAEEQP